MAPVIPDPSSIRSFRTAAAFERWLATHHDRRPEIWLRIYKKASGVPSVTAAEALDIVLCWGWIDGIRKGLDADSFLQRYTPRTARSRWSQVNQQHVTRLTAGGRMTPYGQRAIDAARADGRWEAAYAPIRDASPEKVPPDLRRAIDASPRAGRAFGTLSRMRLFSLIYRTNAMRTPEGRARKIGELVTMLEHLDAAGPTPTRRARKKR